MGDTYTHWRPAIGDLVWFNYPDSPDPEGRVVGYTQDFGNRPEDPRYDQPVILGPKKQKYFFSKDEEISENDRRLFVCHPRFLLPFPYGESEWKKANAEGRITD